VHRTEQPFTSGGTYLRGMIRCSVAAGLLGEPLEGTAPIARRWLAVEHRPTWGRDVGADAGPVIAGLAVRAAAAGARLALIRAVGRPPTDERLRVFLADTTPDRTRLTGLWCTPSDLSTLPLPNDPDGPLPGDAVTEPALLVCTHARRDQCCAIEGRALAGRLAEQVPHVWQCSHLGGHRFSPTAVVLPTGYVYGRLDVDGAVAAVKAAAAGEVETASSRGRSTWAPAGQVAELAVRELTGERQASALDVAPEHDGHVMVRHADGRSWRVAVERRTLPDTRPESCGKPDKPVSAVVATEVRPAGR